MIHHLFLEHYSCSSIKAIITFTLFISQLTVPSQVSTMDIRSFFGASSSKSTPTVDDRDTDVESEDSDSEVSTLTPFKIKLIFCDYLHLFTHLRTQVHTHTHTQTHTHANTHTCTHMHMHMNTHTYTHTHTHIHTPGISDYLVSLTDIRIMYYVYEVRGSSLLLEFTDYLHHFHSHLLHHYD